MSAGPLALVIEPEGYYYAKEEGVYMIFDGDDLAATESIFASDGFWKASTRGGWIHSKPLQIQEDWYKDSRMEDHVLYKDDWFFDSGSSQTGGDPADPDKGHFLDEEKLLAGNHEFPWNLWTAINTKIAVGDLDTFANMADDSNGISSIKTALERDANFHEFPDDMHVRAVSKELIPEGKSPVWRVSVSPRPTDLIILGFGQFAIVIINQRLIILESKDNNLNWEVIDKDIEKGKYLQERRRPYREVNQGISSGGTRFGTDINRQVATHEFVIVGDGTQNVCLIGKNGNMAFKSKSNNQHPTEGDNVVTALGVRAPIRQGRLWIAARDTQQIFIQPEIVAYDVAEHLLVDDPLWPIDPGWLQVVKDFLVARRSKDLSFDFGDEYKPTVNPKVAFNILLHDTTYTKGTTESYGHVEYIASVTGERAEFGIYNEKGADPSSTDDYEQWASDGTHSKGRFHIKLTPSDDFEMCPQIKNIVVGFPALLALRYRQQAAGVEMHIQGIDKANVGDSKLARLACSTSYDELLDKKFEAVVYENVGYRDILTGEITQFYPPTIGMHSFEGRQEFPVDVREDINNDGIYEATRIRAWIKKVTKGDVKWIDFDRDGIEELCVREYHLVGVGLGSRADRQWMFVTSVQAPENAGSLSHTELVRKCLASSGINVDDPVEFVARLDTDEPPETKYLPAGTNDDAATMGQKVKKNAFQPEWNDSKADTAQTVADAWSGKRLVERMSGKITYLSDEITEAFYGKNPQMLCTFFPSLQMTKYGFPFNVYLEQPMPTTDPMPVQANAIRIIAADLEDKKPYQIIAKIIDTVDPTAAGPPPPVLPENFVGEWKPAVFMPQYAIDEPHAINIAYAMLSRAMLKADLQTFTVATAPWNMPEVYAIPEDPSAPTLERNPLGAWHDFALDVGDGFYLFNYGKHIVFHMEYIYEGVNEQITNIVARKLPKSYGGRLGT